MKQEFEFEEHSVNRANHAIRVGYDGILGLPENVRLRAAIELKRLLETSIIDTETQRLTNAGSAILDRFEAEQRHKSASLTSVEPTNFQGTVSQEHPDITPLTQE